MKIKDAKSLAEAKIKAQEPIFPGSMRITVGTASCGIAKGAAKTLQALKSGITYKENSCPGGCCRVERAVPQGANR